MKKQNGETMKNIWKRFLKLSPDEAISILWDLSYSKESAQRALERLDVKNAEDWELKRGQLAKTLEKHYKSTYPDYCKQGIMPELKEAFNKTAERVESQAIAYVIYSHCWPYILAGYPFFERTLFLLTSKTPSKYLGGIQSLDFSQKETAYLAPFHEQIGELFKEIGFCCENQM